MNRMSLSLQRVLGYADAEVMLKRIVTGVDSWVHHYQPESKRASMQWKHRSSTSRSTKKFKVTPAVGKVMLTVFGILRQCCHPIFRSVVKTRILYRTVQFCRSVEMQFVENVQSNWQEGYCFIMTMPHHTQLENSGTTVRIP
jgi:hypothetical protein